MTTLFRSEPQYRERATIWRIFSQMPLFAPLAGGRVWKWFAINIPMDLGTGGTFTSDMDVIARLHDFPRSQEWLYKTWEVKVSLLRKDGSALSLKAGKLKRTVTQLKAYRDFGSPAVSLIDVYVCEAGFMGKNNFPPPVLERTILAKIAELSRHGFGYQLLPFEHGEDADGDVGLLALHHLSNPLKTHFDVLPTIRAGPRQPFSRLAERLNDFFEHAPERRSKNFNQIVFCRECRQLQLISTKNNCDCPHCKSDLVAQS